MSISDHNTSEMGNILEREGADKMIGRINNLSEKTEAQWGKMKVDQMLAHCCVAYDMTFTDKYPKPNGIKRFFIKLFAKPVVVGPKPYPKNSRTAPEFIIEGRRDFEEEKARLIAYVRKAQELGPNDFDGRESHAMGALSSDEWNTLFAKHLDHHLTQFGV